MEEDLDKVSIGTHIWQDIVKLTYDKIKISIDNSPKTVIKDNYSRELGINPVNNKIIDVYIGQYGPVLREQNSESGCKPRFVSIKDYNLDDFTLDQALNLLKYPHTIGTYQDKDVILDKGRFGLYIKYDSKNYSYKIEDESNINLKNVIEFIDIKNSNTSSNGVIKKLNDKISVLNGQYGPCIRYDNKTNYKILLDNKMSDEDKEEYLNNLTLDDCKEIISNSKNKKSKSSSASKEDTTKKTTTKKKPATKKDKDGKTK
jgi:DNA topoisomerase-1